MCAYLVLKFDNKYSLLCFSYFLCAYIIVLKFNNKYSLLCFRILFDSIYIENTNRELNLPLFTCDCSDHSPLMGSLNPS